MKWSLVAIVILVVIVGYTVVAVASGPFTPLGRMSFVKVANPDFYPGHPHSELLVKYAEERNSNCALICHFAGSSNYRSYQDGDVYIIELALIDTQGTGAADPTNYWDSAKLALFGAPEGRYKYKSDGLIFDTYDEAMNHVNTLAREHNQSGPLPIAWHGNARQGNAILIQGCGFPLYFQIMQKTYGIVPAYFCMFYGMIFPYMNTPYRNFELGHASELQSLYNEGELDYT
ncbi:hypothetical protein [uncultured Methanobacterium sp.]|uniref:hypothetical protein n=1 Tax=uncultured Methanobacterium sp. TaxID=176306 RepID=UPI002AA79E4B|nr:hypothetical protein [uncultured Methanobacterium sp.]